MKLETLVGGQGSVRGSKKRLDVSGRPLGGVWILFGKGGIRLLVFSKHKFPGPKVLWF